VRGVLGGTAVLLFLAAAATDAMMVLARAGRRKRDVGANRKDPTQSARRKSQRERMRRYFEGLAIVLAVTS